MAVTIAATVGIQALGLGSGAILARLLGVENRGLLAAVVLWPSVIVYLGDLGGPVAYTYLSSTYGERVAALANNALYLSLLQTAALVAVGIPVIVLALHGYADIVWLSISFLLGYVPLNLLTRYFASLHQGQRHFGRFNAVRIAVQAATVCGVLVLYILQITSVKAVVIVTLAANALALVLAVFPFLGSLSLRQGLDARLARATFRYGLRAHFGNLTPIDAVQLDLLAVVTLLGVREAGLYTVAASAAMVIRAQGTAIGMVAMPTVGHMRLLQDRLAFLASILRASFALHVLSTAVILVLAERLIRAIYGPDFSAAAPIARVLCVGMIAASLRQIIGDAVRGLGRPLAATIGEFLTLLIGAGALVILVPSHGALGAAVAVSVTYGLTLVAGLLYLRFCGLTWSMLVRPSQYERDGMSWLKSRLFRRLPRG